LTRTALAKLRAFLLALQPATSPEEPVGGPLHPWAPATSDRTRCLHEPVAVLSDCTDCPERQLVEAARQAQAIGDLLKDLKGSALDERAGGMRPAYAGQPTLALAAVQAWAEAAVSLSDLGRDLTEREREVLGLIVEGLCNAGIGRQLCITASTVKFHVTNILRKLGAVNRAQAAALAVRYGLVL
jgi:DNA-binding NarL/FixJ family response regulator